MSSTSFRPASHSLPSPALNEAPSRGLSPAASASTLPVQPQIGHDLPAAGGQARRLSSEALLANRREVEIEHAGQVYRLRLTSLGKLILTK